MLLLLCNDIIECVDDFTAGLYLKKLCRRLCRLLHVRHVWWTSEQLMSVPRPSLVHTRTASIEVQVSKNDWLSHMVSGCVNLVDLTLCLHTHWNESVSIVTGIHVARPVMQNRMNMLGKHLLLLPSLASLVLHMESMDLNDAECVPLLRGIEKIPTLKHLGLHLRNNNLTAQLAPVLSCFSYVPSIDFDVSLNYVNDTVLHHLLYTGDKATKCIKIDMRQNRMTNTTMLLLRNTEPYIALQELQLNLSNRTTEIRNKKRCITNRGILVFVHRVLKLAPHLHTLALTLENQYIGAAGVQTLSYWLTGSQAASLKNISLYFASNGIGWFGFRTLVASLPPSVVRLKMGLQDCALGDCTPWNELTFSRLKQLRSLTLHLDNNELNERGLKGVIAGVKQLLSLRTLVISLTQTNVCLRHNTTLAQLGMMPELRHLFIDLQCTRAHVLGSLQLVAGFNCVCHRATVTLNMRGNHWSEHGKRMINAVANSSRVCTVIT